MRRQFGRIPKLRLRFEPLETRHLLAAQPVINEFVAANDGSLLDGDGNESDWIELHNAGDESIDLGGWYLTDSDEFLTKWQIPSGTDLGAGDFLVVFASSPVDLAGDPLNDYVDAGGNLHTNFSLRASGEYVGLVRPDGLVASAFAPRLQVSDIAYGTGQNGVGYLKPPTPNAPNGIALSGFVRDTTFSVDRGFYNAPFDVEIATDTVGADIYYTLDGTIPSADNPTASRYSDSITIRTTATLRAIAVADGMLSTNVDTHTYIFLDDVLQQPNAPDGYPSQWAGRETISADYEMDPEIVNHPEYGPQLKEALAALPTVSLVMDADDWFDADAGIYSNSEERGDFWERAVSAEFFGFEDVREFQVNAGIQMQGNASRWPSRPKHNMRLVFADRFGAGRLNFPLFDNTNIDSFNSIVLRGGNGDSWINSTVHGKAQYIRDQWHRGMQTEMGHDTALQSYAHLYINGMYWGMFHLFERIEAQFMSEHYGGQPTDYEVIKDIRNSGGQVEALDGTTDAWLEMTDRAKGNMSDPAEYAAVIDYLDVENYIDYLMVNFYTANNDWDQSNWRAGRRIDGGKFRFFSWDAERTDFNANGNNGANASITRNTLGKNNVNYPTWLHQRMSVNEDYQIAWADRVQKHMFNGGTLTPEAVESSWNSYADEIRVPIIAESARWGDAHVSNPRTQATWENQLRDLNQTYFPARTNILLDQLKDRGLFPEIEAPEFSDRGGTVASGFTLELATDLVVSSVGTLLLDEDHAVRAFVPSDASLDGIWYASDYVPNDSWTTGMAGVGFDKGTNGLQEAIQLNVVEGWDANQSSIYSRSEFSVDLDSLPNPAFEDLTLRMKYDDGFIAYLNGVEVARSSNAPDQPTFDSLVLGGRPDGDVLAFVDFDLAAFQDLLVDEDLGTNVLALHGFNATRFSNDMLISAELVGRQSTQDNTAPIYYTLDGSDPRSPGGEINDLGNTTFLYDGQIAIEDVTTVRARVLSDGDWSALDEATFVVNPAPASSLIVSEINYNPSAATPAELAIVPGADNDDFEFVEVMNIGTETVNLLGVRFDDGVEFTFGDVELAASERVVVARDVAAFGARYGDSTDVAGEYDGTLNNSGEQIRLTDADGSVAVEFSYSDSRTWPQAADGAGASLVLVDSAAVEAALLSKYYRWRSSEEVGGSPGTAGPTPIGVVISEILANTDELSTSTDAIELHNPTDAAIDVGGWFLSDSVNDLLKFEIPTGTILAANEYLVFTESDFNPTPQTPSPNHFALSSRGDDVWLVIPEFESDERVDVATIVDDVYFGATFSGQSLGLTDQSTGRLAPLSRGGLGCGGNHNYVPHAVIERINYLPGEPSPASLAVEPNLDNNDLEYLIIASSPVTGLTGWRIRGGIEFDFPASAQTSDWIVSFDPDAPENAAKADAFRAHYDLDDTLPRLIGGYSGSLSNTGEDLRLQAPMVLLDETAYVTVDEVIFDDRGDWPASIVGEAISRKRTTYFGNDGSLWEYADDASPTPLHEKGDLNGDGGISIADLDQLIDAVNLRIESIEYVFATTLTTPIQDDIDFFIPNVAETIWGDATNDGVVDAADLNQLGRNWQETVCGGWADGDFNGDGLINAADLNVIGVHWQMAGGPLRIRTETARTLRAPLNHGANDIAFASIVADSNVGEKAPRTAISPGRSHRAMLHIHSRHGIQRRDNAEDTQFQKLIDELLSLETF